MWSVQKVSSHVIWKIETFIEEDTRYKKHYTQDYNASAPFKVGTLGPHTVLLVAISCPVGFSWISLMVWDSAQDMMLERAHHHDKAAHHQLPIAAAFWIIRLVSAEKCSSLMENLMQIHCSTHSVILNAKTTQYTCSLNGIYHPHWLVTWSHHCSHMHIPAHSPWLPGYINITWTIFVMLTMTGLFLDRLCMYRKK